MNKKGLTFLGRGSAFNYLEDNTCAYFIIDKHLFLFDCGEKIASKIIYLKLLDNIEKVSIFITHLHSDHIGSLEGLLTFIKVFKTDIEVNVIYPNKDKLSTLLKLLNFDFDIDILDKYDSEELSVKIISQPHIGECYGFIVKSKEVNFFYSGDTSKINDEALKMLLNGELDYFYHEVSRKQSSFHTGLETLEKLIPNEFRSKVYLMHFSDDKLMFECIEKGFNVVR